MFIGLFLALLFLIVVVLISVRRRESLQESVLPTENLMVKSDSFERDGEIVDRYSGYGEDQSPELHWDELDERAVSIAVIMDDLDHPLGIFNHWVMWNLPANRLSIPEGISHGEVVEELDGAIQGKSEYGGKHYYRGPKPPMGSHRYRFQVFVLDTMLSIPMDSTKLDVMHALEDHVLQYGSITGIYGKS